MGWLDLLTGDSPVDYSLDTAPSDWLNAASSSGYGEAPSYMNFMTSGQGLMDSLGDSFVPDWSRFQVSGTQPDVQQYVQNYPMDLGNYAPQQAAALFSGGIWDTLQQAGRFMESPGGEFGAGLIGAGVSAYGANKANKNNKKAYKKQQEMLAARQAKQAQYDSPLRLVNGRQQLAVPQQRNGEAVFFSNNKLPSYFAEGGGVSEEQYAQMVAEAQQARADAQMDRPSMVGFLRYLANGKRMPSELAAAKRAQRTVPDVIQTRQRKIEEAANYAQGGSPNYVAGGTPGQADKIPAQLSDGEYVMDADVVSALGDGNNAAGAAKLDQMRQNIRAHKRNAPVNKIPPKAKSPLAYMKKGAK